MAKTAQAPTQAKAKSDSIHGPGLRKVHGYGPGRGRKASGWQLSRYLMPFRAEKVTPSRWEQELERRGLTEAQVRRKPRLMEEWVRKEAFRAFVPEWELDALGVVVEG